MKNLLIVLALLLLVIGAVFAVYYAIWCFLTWMGAPGWIAAIATLFLAVLTIKAKS